MLNCWCITWPVGFKRINILLCDDIMRGTFDSHSWVVIHKEDSFHIFCTLLGAFAKSSFVMSVRLSFRPRRATRLSLHGFSWHLVLVRSMQCAWPIFPHVNCLAIQYFPALSHKRQDFRRKNYIEHDMFVLILSANLNWNIAHFKKNWARYDKKCTRIVVFN